MDIFLNQEALKRLMSEMGFLGPIVFFLLQVLQAIIAPIPGNLMTVAGSALFGFWPGFLLSYTGNVVGSLVGFSIIRKVGRAAMVRFMSARRFDRFLEIMSTDSASSRTKILLILVILLPFLPSDLICLAAGLTAIPFRTFLIIVITCRPWGQLAAAVLGAGSLHIPPSLLFPIIAVVIAVCIVGIFFAPRLEAFVLRWASKLADRFC